MTIIENLQSLFQSGKTFTAKELLAALSLPEQDAKALRKALDQLSRDNLIYASPRGKYGLPEAFSLSVGTLQGSRGEFCFFIPQNKSGDLYIAAQDLHTGLHGDTVWVRALPASEGHKAQGEVVRVIVRANETVVGTLVSSGKRTMLLPDNKRLRRSILIAGSPAELPSGYKAVCRVTDFTPNAYGDLKGVITELIGDKDAPGTDIRSIVKMHGLPEAFPDAVLAAAERAAVPATATDLTGRRDFRSDRVFTIDGDDSKDLDDAVSIRTHDDGTWTLGVHIADVSHYVRSGSALDAEAYKRGTSVYLVDRVIPMLPTALSNGICSLNPNEDRLTLSAVMHISARGEVLEYEIMPSVIRSCERLTYKNVAELLRGDEALSQRYAHIRQDLQDMERLHRVLYAKRVKRGSIEFELPETHIILNEAGKPVSIEPEVREVSHCMIEEFMLIANETVAQFMQQNHIPCIYRVHETPDSNRLDSFNEVVSTFGYHLNTDKKISPLLCAQLLQRAQGAPEEALISRLLLRSMKKARYCESNLGHFGLAAENYLHFTSPIRRYPDLLVHRALHLFWEHNTAALAELEKRAPEFSQRCSENELIAQEAERDTDDLKKTEFMAEHIGEIFEGMISGVSASAFWVELANSAEGVVPLASLPDDYYVYNEKLCAVIGERKRKVYRFGDRVCVRVHSADPEARRIELEMIKKL